MSSTRLFYLAGLLTIGLCGYAISIVSGGQPLLPGLPLLLLASVAGTLLIGLFGRQTRPRAMLRFLATLCALVAVLSFVADFVRPADGSDGTLLGHIQRTMPTFFESLKDMVSAPANGLLWDPLMTSILAHPTWVIFLVLAFILGYAGRPLHRVEIFTN